MIEVAISLALASYRVSGCRVETTRHPTRHRVLILSAQAFSRCGCRDAGLIGVCAYMRTGCGG